MSLALRRERKKYAVVNANNIITQSETINVDKTRDQFQMFHIQDLQRPCYCSRFAELLSCCLTHATRFVLPKSLIYNIIYIRSKD